MNRITHFEINSDNPERAAKFFKEVFNWDIKKWDSTAMDYWTVMTGEKGTLGINGGITKRTVPANSFVNYIDVADVDDVAKKITASGGKILTAKTEIPKVGWFIMVQDPDGNMFGAIQMSPEGMAEMAKN